MKITGTGWLIKRPFSITKIFRKRNVSGMTHMWDSPSTALPAMLIEGDEVSLFKALDGEWIQQISSNISELKAKPKNLKFCVYTSYGKSIWQKASDDFIEVIERSIAENRQRTRE